ncbi:MAG: spermidine synthase [Bacteroidota bacterium]|jgi:spermidine synthase
MDFLKRLLSFIRPVILRTEEGRITQQLEVVYENGRKVLHAATVNYSFGALHDVFRAALKRADVQTLNPRQVLILGFGGGSIARILHHELQLDAAITGVDADEIVLQLAREEFDAGKIKHLKLITAKAQDFVQHAKPGYDLICVDVFVEAQVPAECRTNEFIKQLHTLLNKKGTLIFNFMRFLPDEHLPLQTFLNSSFSSVDEMVMHLGDADNVVWVCTK